MSEWIPDSERIERVEGRLRELSEVVNDLGMTVYKILEREKCLIQMIRSSILGTLQDEMEKRDARKTTSE